MKNLNENNSPQLPVPRPNAPLARSPRRRLNPAKAVTALAVAALLALGGFALNADAQWQKPMPLVRKAVTVQTPLPTLAPPQMVTGQGANLPEQVTLPTQTYATVPMVVTAYTVGESVRITGLPSSATVTPAGDTVEIIPISQGHLGGLGWRSSVGSNSLTMPLTQGTGYASWFVRFAQPGVYPIAVTVGGRTRTVAVRVVPLPRGTKVSVHTTYASHPQLTISNPASVPIPIVGGASEGLPNVLQPGASFSLTPPSTLNILTPPTRDAGTELAFSSDQQFGSVHVSGTYPVVHHIWVHPERGAFQLPAWWDIALIAAALLLVTSLVGAARGGRGGRGVRGGRGTSGPDANAS